MGGIHQLRGDAKIASRLSHASFENVPGVQFTTDSCDSLVGPLESHEDAKRWLKLIGEAVVGGVLSDRAAVAGIKAVEAWLRAEGDRVTMKVVEELKGEVERLKAEMAGGGKRRLRSV